MASPKNSLRGKHLVLIGFSGSGKSTIGPLLAARLKRRFIDVDERIEIETGLSIDDIFKRNGERWFRRRETTTTLAALGTRRGAVIALGGGAFETREIRRAAHARGWVVYLSCSRREIYRRLKDKQDRPLLKVRPKSGRTLRETRLDLIARLMKKRLANYRAADLVISTTGKSPARIVRQLLGLLG